MFNNLIKNNFIITVITFVMIFGTTLTISSFAQPNNQNTSKRVKVNIKKSTKQMITLSINDAIIEVPTSLFEESQKLAVKLETQLTVEEKSKLIESVGTSNVPQWLLSVGAAAAAVASITGVWIGRALAVCAKELWKCASLVWGFIQGVNSADDIRRKLFN